MNMILHALGRIFAGFLKRGCCVNRKGGCHCERSEAIQVLQLNLSGLLRSLRSLAMTRGMIFILFTQQRSLKPRQQGRLLVLILLLFSPLVYAKIQPLPVEQAFRFSASATDAQTIVAHWEIAPGYYLYRDRALFKPSDSAQVTLGKPLYPNGITKESAELGRYQVYQHQADIAVPVIQPNAGKVSLQVTYQGCSASGFCYPPITKAFTLNLSGPYGQATRGKTITAPVPATYYVSAQEHASQLLADGNLALIILSFIGFGLLLAFTPCVLPMIPILSGIIVGQGKAVSTGKAFRLSLVYVLSMALTYAVAGLLIGWVGSNIQVVLQQPWIIILFSLIFVALALSLFGFYELQMPKSWQAQLARLSNRQQSGRYVGVAIMGCLATLIVSPCVTPPLVGVLSYIGHTGSAWLGGIALFSLGIGMGIPLLLIGTSGGKWLPKAGVWMDRIKAVLGVLLLAVAIWMLQRILPGPVSLLLWAALLIICAIFLGALSTTPTTGWEKLWKGVGFLLLIYGVLLLIGAARGHGDPFKPLAASMVLDSARSQAVLPFQLIKNYTELQQALALAKQQNRPVMVDFYADWCVSCKIMAKKTFTHPAVQQALRPFLLLQADITANTPADQALLKRLNVIAPPTLLFYDPSGNELTHLRIVGETGPQAFLEVVRQVD